MEELKQRYIRTFVIFAVLVGGAVAFLRTQLNSMTEAQKTQVVEIEKKQVIEELKRDEQEDGEPTSSVEYTATAQEALEELGLNFDEAVSKLLVSVDEGEPLQRAKAAIALASAYEQKSDYAPAIDAYKRALEFLENRAEKKETHKKIAELHLYQGEQSAALVHYEEVYKMTKETADFHNLADLLAKENNVDKLRYYYDKHVAWFPESTEALSKYDAWLKMRM